MQKAANRQLETALDNNSYDNSQLIEFKVALNLPYQTSNYSYERYNGEIDINGTQYKYVKRKVVDDTLYVMCIPNTKTMHLETAKNDFFKMVNDLGTNKSSKKDNSKNSFQQSEYDQYLFTVNTFSGNNLCNNLWLTAKDKSLTNSVHTAKGQPPDLFI